MAGAVGTADFEGFDFGGGAEAEVGALVGGGGVAAAGEDVRGLAEAFGGEVDLGIDGFERGVRAADQLEGGPVFGVCVTLPRQRKRNLNCRYGNCKGFDALRLGWLRKELGVREGDYLSP